MPRLPSKSVLLSTAYHEAGHAVAAFLQDIRFEKGTITIVPADGASGYFTHEKVMKRLRPDLDCSDRVRIRAEKLIVLCLAGPEAQRRHRASSVRSYHASSDYNVAVDCSGYFVGNSEVHTAYMKYLLARTKALFYRPRAWEAVEALAGELVSKRTLRGDEALKVIRSAFAVRS